MARNKEHGAGYLYGICTNRDKDGNGTHCSKCDSKEVQKIRSSKDFVCEECGELLMKTTAPDEGSNNKLWIIIAAIAIIAAIIGCIFAFSGSKEEVEPTSTEPINVEVNEDSIKAAQAAIEQQRVKDSLQAVADSLTKVAEEAAKAKDSKEKAATAKPAAGGGSAATAGTKNLGYAVYRGTLKNGQPDGVNGRLTFKERHVIDSKDPKGRVAESGDYVIGEFVNGHLVQGRWYGADNVVKGSIMIGL